MDELVRPWNILLLLALVSCGSHPQKAPSAATPAASSFRLRDFRFKSGLRVVGEEDTTSPIVGVVNVVGAGSASDPPGKEGLAHLVEHLTFRAKRENRTTWSLFQQAGAGLSSGTTYHDSTVFYEFGPRDALLDLLVLEASRMTDPLVGIDEQVFNVEREVVRNELRQRGETVVDGTVWAELSKAVYPEIHPYSRPIIGTHESLNRLTLADAREFAKRTYRPANMTMVVTGDFPLDRLDKFVTQAFPASLGDPTRDAKAGESRMALQSAEPPAPPPSKGIVTIEGMVTAPELHLAWSLPPSYGSTSHLARIAEGGLYGAIEHAEDHDSDVIGGSADLIPGVQSSMVLARVILREGSHPERSAEFVLNGLMENWLNGTNLRAHQVWFERVIARAATTMLFESEDISERAIERANFAHFTGDLGYVGHRLDAVGALNPSQLETFYSQYLNRDRARIVLVRPIPSERQGTFAHVGIGESKDSSAPVQYDIASLRKLAVSPSLNRLFRSRTLKNGLYVEA
ncbi:MAG: pitrilysin family protein, partial [Polyangiaceae bacterium]